MPWLPVWHAFECQPGDVVEDAIDGDERDAKAQGGSGHPSIGVVVPLPQCMADALAVDAELGVDEDEFRTRVYDLSFVDPRFELEHPGLSPASSQRAVAQLGRRLKGDERGSTDDDRFVDCGELRAGDEVGPKTSVSMTTAPRMGWALTPPGFQGRRRLPPR